MDNAETPKIYPELVTHKLNIDNNQKTVNIKRNFSLVRQDAIK